MNRRMISAAALAVASMGSTAASSPTNALEFKVSPYPWPTFDRPLYIRASASGIPTAPRINQRKRRKLHRRTRPHGWKGGAA